MTQNYDKMLIDFMYDGIHRKFLTDEQWWNVFDMANGVPNIKEYQYEELSSVIVLEHITKSSKESKKKMTNYILDLISAFGLNTPILMPVDKNSANIV